MPRVYTENQPRLTTPNGITAGPMPEEPNQLTALLNGLDRSQGAQERVFKLVYDELRRIAHKLVSGESPRNSLQATELLHETYLKKLRNLRVPIRNRQHFYSLAARAMRQVMIEDARRRKAEKREPPSSGAPHRLLGAGAGAQDPIQVLQISPLLDHLQEIDPRAASVVDLRFFLGCSLEETADVLGVSLRNVRDDWDFAKVWLKKQLGDKLA